MSRNINLKNFPCSCKFDSQMDFERTKPGLAITPAQVQELSERGIPVSAQNAQLQIFGDSSWNIEPIFKREMDMATAWEIEKTSQAKVRQALKRQKSDAAIKAESEKAAAKAAKMNPSLN